MKLSGELRKLIDSKKPILKSKLLDLIENDLANAFDDGHWEGYAEGESDSYGECDREHVED
jgi:hypothetical protein